MKDLDALAASIPKEDWVTELTWTGVPREITERRAAAAQAKKAQIQIDNEVLGQDRVDMLLALNKDAGRVHLAEKILELSRYPAILLSS